MIGFEQPVCDTLDRLEAPSPCLTVHSAGNSMGWYSLAVFEGQMPFVCDVADMNGWVMG